MDNKDMQDECCPICAEQGHKGCVEQALANLPTVTEEDLRQTVYGAVIKCGANWTRNNEEAYLIHPTQVCVRIARAILSRFPHLARGE